MFRKMKVGQRVGYGFSAVLLLMLVVGAAGWLGLDSAENGFTDYRELARDTNLTGRLQANMLMVRMNVKDFIITGAEKDRQQYADYLKKMNGFLEEAKREIRNPERAEKIRYVDKVVVEYEKAFAKVVEFRGLRDDLVNNQLNKMGPEMERKLTQVMESAYKDGDPEAAYYGGEALRSLLLARLYVIKFLNDNSQASVDRVRKEYTDFRKGMDELKARVENPTRKGFLDEINKLKESYMGAFEKVVALIFERNGIITNTLDRIGPDVAGKVEDVKLDIKAAQDSLGPQLVAANERSITIMQIVAGVALIVGIILAVFITKGITGPLSRIIDGLTSGADQVASASTQVASSSVLLAESSSEQAASLEETSSSMEEMASMTKSNAQNAGEADGLMKEALKVIDQAGSGMGEMSESMTLIAESGDEISKIVKSIDEIAFQTNLLALNAAVEAARAGEAGMGFAVVADEVRALALRAAEAAKSTQVLIEDTVRRIQDGTVIVDKTKNAFEEIATSSTKVASLVTEIAAASDEQAQGIGQVNTALTQMDGVVQQVAASAEESSSASQQMNSQAAGMKEMVLDLTAMIRKANGNGSNGHHALPAPTTRALAAPQARPRAGEVRPEQAIPFDEDDLGDF